MKRFLLPAFALLYCQIVLGQSVAINNDGSLPNASAILDIKSTTKGLLMPRMTTAQRNVIITPAEGLKVFDTDTKTFWFYNGTGWIESAGGSTANFWSLNGANIFKTNAGNVGIGTNTPAQLLTIQSPVNSYGITHTDDNIRLSTFLGGGLGGAWIGTQSDHDFHIYTNSGTVPNVSVNRNFATEFKGTAPQILLQDGNINSGTLKATGSDLTISARTSTFTAPGNLLLQLPLGTNIAAGNVGIGINSPDYKLTISSNITQSNNNTNLINLRSQNPTLAFSNENNIGYGFIKSATINEPGFGTGLIMGSVPGQSLFLSTNFSPTMVIGNNNNVGIGNGGGIQPYKLTVNAGTNQYGIVQTDGAIQVGTWVGNDGGYFGTKTNHPLRFFTNDGLTQMTLLVNGNVGIGTTNPTYKLSVNGNIRSKEVVVESGWADYVFDKNYALRSLDEVEKFIQQHKHLPNIPSAKEVEEKGLHLGDIQKKMMEKIEELTLYMIEAGKQIDRMQKEIDGLKKSSLDF